MLEILNFLSTSYRKSSIFRVICLLLRRADRNHCTSIAGKRGRCKRPKLLLGDEQGKKDFSSLTYATPADPAKKRAKCWPNWPFQCSCIDALATINIPAEFQPERKRCGKMDRLVLIRPLPLR